jgi:ferric-dicitrate binding protein FerR (iron transport regulator)
MKNELNILLEKFLQRQASAEEIIRLKELFNQAEAQEILSALYKEKWEQATFTPETEVEERIWSHLQKKIDSDFTATVTPLPIWKKGLRIAASILIPLFLIGLSYYYFDHKATLPTGEMIVKVDIGQKACMQLPDGTQIWLNSASSLTYDEKYNQKDRIVYLQGEAYFEVGKDKEKPFIVKTDAVSVEALGTSFNVKAYPDDDKVTATLIEGSVRVSSLFQSDLLKPNEKLSFSKSKQQFSKTVLLDAERNASWKNNRLAFEQENLEEIAKVLERMYNVHIQFSSEKSKHIRFSGTIANNNLENVLQLIALVSPVRYSIEKDSVIVIHESSQ